MLRLGPREGPCGWETQGSGVGLDVEDLHQVLNCASNRGCTQCVRCSEMALEKLLHLARKESHFGFHLVTQLELDMDFSAAFGM